MTTRQLSPTLLADPTDAPAQDFISETHHALHTAITRIARNVLEERPAGDVDETAALLSQNLISELKLHASMQHRVDETRTLRAQVFRSITGRLDEA